MSSLAMRANPLDIDEHRKIEAVGGLIRLLKDMRIFKRYEVHTQYISKQYFVLAWLREEIEDGDPTVGDS
jgi:hypothetical protein